MTDRIQTGDLVLRDERAEEVKEKRYQPHPGVILLYLSDWVDEQLVTRIGSTHDGWRVHTGHARPECVGPGDFVEAVWNHGQRLSHPESAGTLPWGDVSGERIVAYRVVPRPCGDPQPDRTAEVRAVAAEMLSKLGLGRGWDTWREDIRAWADRLDSPVPEQLKVGDRVGERHGIGPYAQGVVRAVQDQWFWVAWDDATPTTCLASELERIP